MTDLGSGLAKSWYLGPDAEGWEGPEGRKNEGKEFAY
jgi:hypothetical protein